MQKRTGDGHDFVGRFAEAKNHLRHAVAQRAMMVHLGEPEVLVRHVADFGERLFYVDRALPNLLEEGAELSFVHEFPA